MKTKKPETNARRGPKLRGDVPRKRFNLSLNPIVVERAKVFSEKNGETLSGLVERLLIAKISHSEDDFRLSE